MSGWDYFVRAITTDYANFTDRARRSEYWFFRLFNGAIIFALFMCSTFISIGTDSSEFLLTIALVGLYFIATLIPSAAVAVRRLHDTGHSGWLFLLYMIPSIGFIVALIFGCIDSKPRANKWGPDPKARERFRNYEEDYSDHLVDDDLV